MKRSWTAWRSSPTWRKGYWTKSPTWPPQRSRASDRQVKISRSGPRPALRGATRSGCPSQAPGFICVLAPIGPLRRRFRRRALAPPRRAARALLRGCGCRYRGTAGVVPRPLPWPTGACASPPGRRAPCPPPPSLRRRAIAWQRLGARVGWLARSRRPWAGSVLPPLCFGSPARRCGLRRGPRRRPVGGPPWARPVGSAVRLWAPGLPGGGACCAPLRAALLAPPAPPPRGLF